MIKVVFQITLTDSVMMNSNDNRDSIGNPWLKEWFKRQVDRLGLSAVEVKEAVNTTGVITAAKLDQIIIELNSHNRDFEVLLVRWTYVGSESVLCQMISIKDGLVTVRYYTTGWADKTSDVESSLSDGGTISYIDSKEMLTSIVDSLTVKQAITHNVVSTSSGSVPVNIGGSVMNTGDANGTWNGIVLKPGISISWGSDGNNVFDAVVFDATGTEFLIEYSTVVGN